MLYAYRIRRKLTVVFIIGLFYAVSLYGQTLSDTLKLHEIQIEATRISEPQKYQPIYINRIDSTELQLYNSGNLSELISTQTGAFIQADGPGGLATVSVRGFDASHTQVIWEGIVLNHPMLGVTDLSLLPVNMFSSVQLIPGNPATVFGSGSSGGTVYLSSDLKPGDAFGSNVSVGSFGQNSQSVLTNVESGSWRLGLTAERMGALNNYPYYNDLTGRFEKRMHNEEQGRQFMLNARWKQGPVTIKSGLWYNRIENDIAQSITQYDYSAHQHDQSARWYLHLHANKGMTGYNVRTYYSFYNLHYIDPDATIDSRSHSIMAGGEGRFIHYFSEQFNIGGGFALRREVIHTNNYANGARRWTNTLYLQSEYEPNRRLRLFPALRFDSYSDFGSRLSPSFGVNYTLKDDVLYARAEVKRDFTIPTFNDLYWAVGGNPDLKAEESLTAEGGLTYRVYAGANAVFEITPELYRASQHNGIRWIPQSNGISTPVNILDLNMAGLNLVSMFDMHRDKWMLHARNSFNWTHAVIARDRQNNPDVIGKQLRYVPEWASKTFIEAGYGPMLLYIANRWVGARYTTADHSSPRDPLHAFSVWDMGIRVQLSAGPWSFSIRAGCKNILNKQYQVIAWYPMPGRNYSADLGLKYSL